MKWFHSRQGDIEGTVVSSDDVWMRICVSNRVRVGFGDPFKTGIRSVYAEPGDVITVRKCLLTLQ